MATIYTDKTGRLRTCRVERLNDCADDPMNAQAPMDEIYGAARRQDVRDGCPACRAALVENLSEPEVLARWGM